MAVTNTPLSAAERVDAACDSFEREWRAGHNPRVEDYLAAALEPERAALRAALAAVEAELNSHRGTGETGVGVESVRSESSGYAPTVARPADQPPSLSRINRFELRAVLGTGAFGRVYRAYDPSLDREVALKVPIADTLPTPADRDRFLKEARAAAAIDHPNVCRIHEVGEHAGQPYIVMSLVPGQSLAELLRARAEPLPERQAAVIVHKIALALEEAHNKGVIHRDLKPANVMFDKDRKDIVVMDFGMARRTAQGDARETRSGMVMGTPAYMSPEQAKGDAKDVGPEGDIFSLGIIMYELLAGSRPFSGSVHEVIGQILLLDPEPPSARRPGVNPRLEAICLKAMAKEPVARFASMRELADAVDGYLHPPVNAGEELAWAVEPKPDTGGGAGLSTDTRKLAELFEVVSRQRKIEKAETTAAIEAAATRHRTPRWIFVAFALLIVGGLAAIYFTRNEQPVVRIETVKVTIEVKGIDFRDTRYSFTLDDKPITGEELSKEIELTVGQHELVVFCDAKLLMRLALTVIGGDHPRAEPRVVEEPPPAVSPKLEPKLPAAEAGFVPLFNGRDLAGWTAGKNADSFRVDAGGNLSARSNPTRNETFCLLTEKEYGDYVLRFEFLFDKPQPTATHSSVAIRTGPDHVDGRGCRLEVQLRDTGKNALGPGALIFVQGSEKKPITPVGELAPGAWHAVEIEFRDRRVKVSVNGKLVNDVDLSKLTGFRSYFQRELDRKQGRIGLQSYREETKFRNIRVKELVAPTTNTVASTFDTDDDGWVVAGDAQRAKPIHTKDGGNPGGHVLAHDNAVGGVWYWVAPAKFLGNRSASYGKTLSFDLTQSRTDFQFEDSDVILEGETTTLVFKLPKHPATTWTSYKIPLTASTGWKVKATGKEANEDEMKAVLKSLKRLWIRGEYRDGDDTGQLDNVVME